MIEVKRGLYMKYSKVFKLLSVMFVILIVAAAIGCGKKEAQEATPTPTAISTPTATPAEPAGETGSLSGVTGDVQVLRSWGSSWIAATSGMKIGTGDGLKTGSNGSVLITFFDGSVMEVESDSEISVEELSKASGGSTTVRISQVLGNTVNRVENLIDSSSTYEIETPAGSAVVRGTIMEVAVGLLGDLHRACWLIWDQEDPKGHFAEVSNAGVTQKVNEAQQCCAVEGNPPGAPFYPDPADDPLQGSTMDSGGSQCPPGCYLIQGGHLNGYGEQQLFYAQNGFGEAFCYCPEPGCTPPPSPCPSPCSWDPYECRCMGACY